jgi:hypothetical protein
MPWWFTAIKASTAGALLIWALFGGRSQRLSSAR